MKKLFTVVVSIFLFQTTFSQITTSINPTIAQMTALLQGNGVVVSGLSITCPSGGYATFNNGASALGGGLNSGILLTTGTASNVAGPNTSANNLSYDAGASGSTFGNNLSGGTTYDGCYITFLITPSCATLSINYVFASEEYPEYSVGSINDVFGFGLSGPNPAGGNFTQQNIATLPGTTTPVSIQNVNNGLSNAGPCKNCAYYIATPPGLAYDGCTTVLTASATVVPCQTYTMTIGVWDDSDGILDSGVFLDVNGLSCSNQPAITAAINPSVVCGPQTVTLTASGAVAGGTYTWSAPASGGLAATNGTVVTANPTASTTYTLKYSDINTCPGFPVTTTVAVTFTATPLTVTKSPTGNVCAGQSSTLTANGGAGTYSWTSSSGLSATTGTVVVATPSTTTTYTVTRTNGACVSSTVVTVNVTPSITAVVTPSLTSICTGQTATLVASGGTTYSWTASSGTNPAATATVVVNPSSTTTYTLKATTGVCTATTIATVSITTAPTVTVTPVSTNICSGQSATLTASGGAAPYNWTASTGSNPPTGISVVVSPTITTTYTVISGAGTCTASAISTVSITSIPSLSITPANSSICTGQTATLTVTGGGAPYVWTASDGSTPPNSATIVVSPTAATTSYTVMAGTGTCTNTAVSNVSITAAPSVSVSPVTSSICSGQSVTLTATGGAAPYNWTASTGANPASGISTVVTPTVSTTYTVLSGSGTCTASAVADVSVTPMFTITMTPSITTICSGGTATLVASGANSYIWLPGLNNTATLTTNPSATTVYTIIGTTGPCTNSTVATVSLNIVNTTVTATSNTYCIGGASVTLTGSGATTYSWDPPAGLSSISGTTVTASPTITTTYTLTGTTGSCSSSTVVTITVPPVVTLSVTASNTLICAGSSSTLTASGASTYTWLPVAGSSSTLGVTPPATTDYTVAGQTIDGCVTVPATITVNVDPAVSLTVTPSNTTICNGSTANLIVSGATNYTWTPSTTLSSPGSATVTSNPTITTTYTVTGTSGVCSNSATATVSVITVSTTVAASSNTYCIGGASVTLTGSGATTYSWDPPAGLSSTSGTSVTASPTITTTYTVTGTIGACTSTAAVTITVPPVVSLSVTASNTLICPGTSATLTASGASTYTWLPVAGSGSTLAISPAGTTDYTVAGQTIDGCVTVPATITVNVAPAINLTVTPSNTTICNGGASANLTVSGATNYTWSPATGLNNPNLATVTANPTITTVYSILGATGSCTSAITTTVNVVTVNTTLTATSNTYCIGGASVTLTGSGATTYSWDPPAGLSSTTGNVVTASPTVTTTYTLIGTTGACNSTTVVTITVPALVSLSTTATSSVICLNGAGTSLTASGASTYTWLPGATSTPTLFVNPPSTTNYTVVGQSAEGCYAIPAIQTVSVSAPINPTITATSPTVCLTNTISMSASPSGAGLSYTWAPTTAISGGTNGSGIAALPPSTATVIYTVVVSNGVCVGTNTLSLQVKTAPSANNFITLNNDTICVGGCVTFSATTKGSQPLTYEWYYESGVGTSSVGVHPEACYGSAGSFSVMLITSNACGIDTIVKSNYINVFDYPNLTAYGDTSINIGETAQVFATGGLVYYWSPDVNGSIACVTCSATAVSPTVTTDYIVVSYNSSYCKVQDTVTVIVDVNCGDFFIPNAFSPNDDGLNDVINVHGRCIETFNLQIFDRWGEKVFETSSITDGWDGTYRGQKMNTGVFIYKADGVSIDGQSFNMKGNITLIR